MIPNGLKPFLAQPYRDHTLPYVNRQGDQFWVNSKGEPYRANDLPVKEAADGAKYWHNAQGWLHRATGPAKVYPDGEESYYLDGTSIPYEDWLEDRKAYLTPPITPSRYNRKPLL